MPDPSQFDIDRTYPGRWTIAFSNPPINMFVPTTIVELGTLMADLEADPSDPAEVRRLRVRNYKERMEHPHQSVPNRQVP